MARLRQLNPGNYRSSGNISDEIEHIVRYVNAAELGDKTIGELLAILFDEDGEFAGPIELRLDATGGLQYRIGTYDSDTEGWITLATIDQLTGPAGSAVGTIEGSIFFNRQDSTPANTATTIDYTFTDDDDLFVYKNGALLVPTDDYTKASGEPGTITLGVAANGTDVFSVITVRASSVSNYRRSDLTSTGGQAVFAFVHTDDETLMVFRNGVLQVPGGGNDYTSSASSDTITFTSGLLNGDVVTILTVENLALQAVTGIMLQENYCDEDGLVLYARMNIADGDIPQAKVNGLTALLTNRGRTYVSASSPVSPTAGDVWIDTSASPNVAKFYDGSQWLRYAPDSTLPDLAPAKAGKLVMVNGTGTAYEVDDYDDTHLVPKTYMGAASGVASLDSGGKLPTTQLPDIYSVGSFFYLYSGAIANTSKQITRIFKQKVRLDGMALKTSAGTCDVEIEVDGVVVGSAYGASAAELNQTLGTAIEVDGTTNSKTIGFKVTNNAGGNDLEVAIAYATLSV